MKTLVAFSGKYGTSRMFAKRVADAFGNGSMALDLKNVKTVKWDEWDAYVVGGGIYIGKTRGDLKAFCKGFANELAKKPLGIFICAADDEPKNTAQYLDKNFPQLMLKTAKIKTRFPGGQVLPEKAGFVYKAMFPKMKKSTDEEIQEMVRSFVEQMQQ